MFDTGRTRAREENLMAAFVSRTPLGRSGLQVSKLGLGSSFKAPTSSYLEAFDRGVNYFYWGSVRRSQMGNAIREIARDRREQLVVVLQSYSRAGGLLDRSVEKGLRKLGIDYADVLLLGWHNACSTVRFLCSSGAACATSRCRPISAPCCRIC